MYLQYQLPTASTSQNIKVVSKLFQQQYPEKRFCERKLYLMLYHFATQCAKAVEETQLSIYDNLAFQNALKI